MAILIILSFICLLQLLLFSRIIRLYRGMLLFFACDLMFDFVSKLLEHSDCSHLVVGRCVRRRMAGARCLTVNLKLRQLLEFALFKSLCPRRFVSDSLCIRVFLKHVILSGLHRKVPTAEIATNFWRRLALLVLVLL